MKDLEKRQKPSVKNGFGTTWLGCLVEVEKPRDFDPFGHAGFAHLWLQYD